jgi:hypothetical protein
MAQILTITKAATLLWLMVMTLLYLKVTMLVYR